MDTEAIKQNLAHVRRIAHVPEIVDLDRGPERSKFAGVAWINKGDTWPACGFCSKPLQLFLQLDLSEAPLSRPGWPERGFVQVFYCTTPDTYCDQSGSEPFSPFGKYLCARVIDRAGDECEFTLDTSPVENPLPPKSILGWLSKDDYPAPAELEDVAPGVVTSEDTSALFDLITSPWRWQRGEVPINVVADKVGGWPTWLQDPSRPRCPECQSVMEDVAQIVSNGNLDYMFGDCGIAQLYRCGQHPRTLAFSWAGS